MRLASPSTRNTGWKHGDHPLGSVFDRCQTLSRDIGSSVMETGRRAQLVASRYQRGWLLEGQWSSVRTARLLSPGGRLPCTVAAHLF